MKPITHGQGGHASASVKPNFRPHRVDRVCAAHLSLVRQLPSCLSGSKPCIPHHLLSVPGERGIGMKASDCWTVPLTWEEHHKLHSECAAKTEFQWFYLHGIDDVHSLARDLWAVSGNLEAMERAVARHYQL